MPPMFLEVLQPFFSLYGWCLAICLVVVWYVHRVRKKAAEDEQEMSEAACAARVQELLLRRMIR